MTETKTITPKSTMQEVLEAYPTAQRLLFQRYHIGGCSSCGFSPQDSLEAVLASKGATDAPQLIEALERERQTALKIQISPAELEAGMKQGRYKLIDVRTEDEHRMVRIEGDMLATQELVEEVFTTWPKDTAIVLYCHHGQSSQDAALSLAEQGFTQVKSLTGGIDAWSDQIDPLTPKY